MDKTKPFFTNIKEAYYELGAMTKESNVFSFALKVMRGLTNGTLSIDEYDSITKDMEAHCIKNGIETTCPELCLSLFKK
jgi:hypothetical protein